MPYRLDDEHPAQPAAWRSPRPGASCYRHPDRAASDSCAGCLQPICEMCALAEGSRFLCPECLRGVRRRRRLSWGLVLLLLLAGLAGVVVYFVRCYEPPFDYGRYTARVHRLSGRLERDPCNRVRMLRFAELLLAADDLKRLLARCQRFFAECEDFPRLRWVTYAAHKRMGDYPAALAEVNRLIAGWPYDKDFRWWRGEVHERMGDWEAALADYRQAIGLQPRLRSIPRALVRVARRAGRPCAGILALELLAFHHPQQGADPGLRQGLERLYRAPECAGMAGRGRALVPAAADRSAPPVVDLGRGQQAPMAVDAGVTYSLLAADAAAPLELGPGEEFIVWQSGRSLVGRLVELDTVALAGARADRVAVLVVDRDALAAIAGEAVDGLLGLSFLTRFALERRADDGALELGPKL